MKVIQARNVNDALAQAIPYMLEEGVRESSRDGDVLVAPTPVMTIYSHPRERVLFSMTRDANPFFHLMESLWMLAGYNDVSFPAYFNKNFLNYSDDGRVVHGAYGYRWREHLGYDQLQIIINELKNNPTSRRCVLQMWDAAPTHADGADDLHKAMSGGKDVPCNTHVYFDCRNDVLNMTVCCRSNDVIWGAYGANAVHFSMLQEYIAGVIDKQVGVYRQFSNNFHIYTNRYSAETLSNIALESKHFNLYVEASKFVTPCNMMYVDNIKKWDADLHVFMACPDNTGSYHTIFFNQVVRPMYQAWKERKEMRGDGKFHISKIIALDWQLACENWINRRQMGLI